MPLYITASYQVKPESVNKIKKAIEEFVAYIKANESGTKLYVAWQEKKDNTKFFHFFIFENKAAQDIHSNSHAVKQFESIYSSELVGGDVVFTEYEPVLEK